MAGRFAARAAERRPSERRFDVRLVFLALLVAAFAAYVAGVVLARTAPPRLVAVWTIACAIQLAPLAAPLLLSTDVWTYWDFGRIATVHDAN